MLYYGQGSPAQDFTPEELKSALYSALDKLGPRNKVLALPPDFTRFHSRTGELTEWARDYYGDRLTHIMPALGTHSPMSEEQIRRMFRTVPPHLFHPHRWREDLVTLGEVPSSFIKEVSEGKLDFSWPAQVNKILPQGGHDLILSLGQVVPHEVIGMANYTKNIFVGVGGEVGIHKSHYLGAVYGMERIMGRADSPVRRVLNYGADHFARNLPLVYVLTVISPRPDGTLALRGLFIGDDEECYLRAAELSRQVNITQVERPFKKCVVYLDPEEFHSTWLGNKAIYRSRMAMADGGELIILAPGLRGFGEDKRIDGLIRKYGYRGTEKTLELVKTQEDLAQNLSAAAHLIHGSSEGRFSITYCPGHLDREEVERAGYHYGDLKKMTALYNPAQLREGWNRVKGEEIFFISHPALGLWSAP
ncbi:MAG: lactate racemase domain-containing protein [Spirochaetales bacterium]|nr:lactate racemase domain-containing protein [Spirochaetales bacterium]